MSYKKNKKKTNKKKTTTTKKQQLKTIKNKNNNITSKNQKKSVSKKKKINKKRTTINLKDQLLKIISKKIGQIKNNLKNNKEKKLRKKEQKIKIKEEITTIKNYYQEENLSINLKFILFLILIAIIVIFIIAAFKKDKEREKEISFNKITIEEYFDSYNNKDLTYIYVKENNCLYCNLIEEYLDKLEMDYKIKIEELNISDLNEEEMQKLEKSNSYFEEGWKAPLVFSIKNGKEISNVNGYKEYSVFKKFVEYSNNPNNKNSFTNISVDKYISILDSNESAIVYIGRRNSKGCEIYNPILEDVSKEKNIKVYYIDTDSLDTESDWNKLNNSNDIFKDTWFTPATLLIKEGKIIDYKFESMDKESLEYFIDRNED